MSARTYLSIGDVLSLLREEFPDVTISKIRFLESQGLVDPERSPSGYRKFYERDVDRLRWVLRQQREHFLPLKVIRDRLAAAGNGVPTDDVYQEADSRNGSGGPGPDQGGAHDEGVGGNEVDDVPFEDDEDRDLQVRSEAAGSNASSNAASNVVPITAERPQSAGSPGTPGSHPSRVATHMAAETAAPQAAPSQPVSSQPAPSPRAASQAAASQAAASQTKGPAGTPTAPVVPPAGDSLTLEELCSVSGLTPADVASLESFGLVRPVAVAGGLYYDVDALAVAKMVVGFGRYGVEPRHLRLYRNAVDREIALVEQIVTPLLRQRNPEARRRATESADELVRLGQGLRAALVRSELRHKLGH